MKIQLKEKTDVLGNISFQLWIDGYCERCYSSSEDAHTDFDKATINLKNGYPKERIVKEAEQ